MNKPAFWVLSLSILLQISCSQTAPTTPNSQPGTANQTAAASQSAPENSSSPAANAKRQADQIADLFISGDYDKFYDLTHPKLIDLAGGKDKLIESTQKAFAEMKSEGYEFVSMTVETPTQIVTDKDQTYAVLPTTVKMKVPQGEGEQSGFLLGISADNGQNWKFINGVSKDQLKVLFPEAVDKLQLPEIKAPVITKK